MRNLQKFLRIKKYGLGDPIQLNFTPMSQLELKKDMGTLTGNDFQQAMNRMKNMEFQSTKDYIQQQQEVKDPLSLTNMSNAVTADMESKGMATSIQDPSQSNTNNQNGPSKDDIMGSVASSLGINSDFIGSGKGQVSAGKAMGIGIAATAGVDALNAIDNMAMGDKNFGAQSAAIDSAVHGASQALIKSGNPYAMCCLKDTIVFTSEGKPVLIQDLKKEDGILGYYNKEIIAQPIKELFPSLYKESIQIETEGGNILRCSIDHPIYSALEGRARYFTVSKKKQRRIKEFSFRRADTLKVGDFVAEAGSIPFFGSEHVKLAYLIGLLIGDGTYGKGHKVPRLFTGDSCTWKWLEDNDLGKITAQYYPGERYSKEFREYSFHGLQSLLRECGIYGQAGKNKRLPINLYKWDKNSCAALLAGLFDTDGFVSCTKQHAEISLSQSNIELLKQVKLLLLKFGIHCTIQSHPAKDKYIRGRLAHAKETYVLNIKTRDSVINFYNNITLNIDYKQKWLEKAYLLKLDTKSRDTSLEFHNVVADKIKRIIKLGYCEVYNLSADISHTYLANGIVTHNTAGAALEAANFLTKAGGQTTEGFDVDIKSSGYGNIGHKESSSSRDFGAMIGLGGLNQGKMDRKLAKRNEEAQMALKAANVADTIKFEQEARMNSVQDVIQQNEIALSGGIDSSLLAAKKGGKLKMSNKLKVIGRAKGGILIVEEEPIKQEKEYKLDTSKPWIEEPPIENNITKAKFGAKLEQIDVSDTPSVIPSGALHKNKHNDFDLENITKKGIPVVTVEDDTVTTLPEIQAQEDSIVQHAEVEKEEIIFNKDLTDYIEELRAKWHNSNEQDDSILLEAGMRLAKELIENTEDNTNVTEKAQTQI